MQEFDGRRRSASRRGARPCFGMNPATRLPMLIRLGYDIQFDVPAPVPMIVLLNVHPSRRQSLLEPDHVRVEPAVNVQEYCDLFGNLSTRFVAPAGTLRLSSSTTIED